MPLCEPDTNRKRGQPPLQRPTLTPRRPRARGMIVESEHPVAGKVKIVGVSVKLSETPGSVREPALLLGQHTDEVLHEYLGMNDAELSALRQAGVIGKKR